jgi:hypothetical protein
MGEAHQRQPAACHSPPQDSPKLNFHIRSAVEGFGVV